MGVLRKAQSHAAYQRQGNVRNGAGITTGIGRTTDTVMATEVPQDVV
jgi:hypothetical protein